jgi:hypothetical protein
MLFFIWYFFYKKCVEIIHCDSQSKFHSQLSEIRKVFCSISGIFCLLHVHQGLNQSLMCATNKLHSQPKFFLFFFSELCC